MGMRLAGLVLLVANATTILIVSDVALAQEQNWLAIEDTAIYTASFRALVILFVMAVLIESALSVIFNWRVFLRFFNGKGVKTLVMVAVSALAVDAFDINIVHDLMVAYGKADETTDPTLGFWLTALILAGGSAGVYNLLVALGYRDAKRPEDVAPKPPSNKAWVSVRVIRDKAVGPALIEIQQRAQATNTSPVAIAGVVGHSAFFYELRSLFFRDRLRHPQYGGHEVVPGYEYDIRVVAHDQNGALVPSAIDGTYVFAERAIVDLEVKL